LLIDNFEYIALLFPTMRPFSVLMSMALVVAHDSDETSYLLQTRTQQRVAEVDDCYVTGGCVTTTTPTTTSTTTPTTTTTTPTTTSTTTTTTTTTPTVGEQREDPPDRETDGGDDDFDRWDYCQSKRKLEISNLKSNNLGGMGPNFDDEAEIRYSDVLSWKRNVDLVITSVPTSSGDDGEHSDGGKKGKKGKGKGKVKGKGKGKGNDDEADPYYENNFDFSAKNTNGQDFIAKYNGNAYRSDVMAIGSLATGNYTFRFCFEDADGLPVSVPFIPMTFFDLDGDTKVEPKSYEEVSTHDAFAMETVKGSEVEHECTAQKDGSNFCKCSSAKKEIEIPSHFGSLSASTRVAAVTMFFKQKSCFELTYTLNYPHRVFLFKGQCFKSA